MPNSSRTPSMLGRKCLMLFSTQPSSAKVTIATRARLTANLNSAITVAACCSNRSRIVGPSGFSGSAGKLAPSAPPESRSPKQGASLVQWSRGSFQTYVVGKSVSSQSSINNVSSALCHESMWEQLVWMVQVGDNTSWDEASSCRLSCACSEETNPPDGDHVGRLVCNGDLAASSLARRDAANNSNTSVQHPDTCDPSKLLLPLPKFSASMLRDLWTLPGSPKFMSTTTSPHINRANGSHERGRDACTTTPRACCWPQRHRKGPPDRRGAWACAGHTAA
mmetsp:Transcript_12572/g.36119  ORF Transcript_12572/g.36119 Transcript_12572/m.36119 type:complete len:279 (-) Transcript_12572:7-843(-)